MKAVLNEISRSYLDDIAHPNPIRTRKRAMGPDWIAAKKGGDTGDTAECTKVRRITSVTRASFAASRPRPADGTQVKSKQVPRRTAQGKQAKP